MSARCSRLLASVLGVLIATAFLEGQQDATLPASKGQVLWQFEAGG
jgi:hypothetical protein